MTHVTIPTNSSYLYKYVQPYIVDFDNISNLSYLNNKVKVFINGCWIGVLENPYNLYSEMKDKKYKGIINIYTSIIFDYKN